MASRNDARADKVQAFHRNIDGAALRYRDMRLDFEHEGEILLSVGGVWDRVESPRLKSYVLDEETGEPIEATRRVVLRIHEGQVDAVRWFAPWLAAHATRRTEPPVISLAELEGDSLDTDPIHAYSALFAGGRRGGKTWIGPGGFAPAYAVAFPGSIVWVVSPSDQKHDEVRRYLAGSIPPEWIERETRFEYELSNGSIIQLKSAYVADGLKEGKADLVILNEGQMMNKRAYTVARGAIVDSSGLVLVCANPPVEKKDQVWVSDFAADAQQGKRASVYIEFNPLRNPHIDRRALLAMRAEVDERTFSIEVLGQFRGPADAVAYNWIRKDNERKVPSDFRDVTEQFLAQEEEGVGIRRLLGLDVQRFPYIGGPVYKFFVPPGEPVNRETVLAWIVGEVVLEGGDEVDYCTAAREKGYSPSTTLIVCDATGEYQHSRRKTIDSPPASWQGRGSFDIIRGEGYRRIVPPSRRFKKKNPPIVDRMRAFTSMIASGVGRRRLFADPDLAPKTCKAIREWKQVHGTPSRTADEAHLGDGASYPIIRLFPRILRSGKPGTVDPVVQRVDLVQPEDGPPLRIVPTPPPAPRRGPRRGNRMRGF